MVINKVNLKSLAKEFRNAIELAIEDGELEDDSSWIRFPNGCCGEASTLLAEYLRHQGMQTWYVCGTYYPSTDSAEDNWKQSQSHAWITDANPKTTDDYIIIDITGDQFKYNSEFGFYDSRVYVGPIDEFHSLFDVERRDIHFNEGIDSLGDVNRKRLQRTYKIILDKINGEIRG